MNDDYSAYENPPIDEWLAYLRYVEEATAKREVVLGFSVWAQLEGNVDAQECTREIAG